MPTREKVKASLHLRDNRRVTTLDAPVMVTMLGSSSRRQNLMATFVHTAAHRNVGNVTAGNDSQICSGSRSELLVLETLWAPSKTFIPRLQVEHCSRRWPAISYEG